MQHEAGGDSHTSKLLTRTLVRGFACLRFPAELESRFQRHDFEQRVGLAFWAGVAAMLAFAGLLIVDHCMVPDQLPLAVGLRLGVYIPCVALGLYRIGRSPRPREVQWLASFYGMLASVLTVAISMRSQSAQHVHHLVVLNAIVVFSATVGRFWPTLCMCAVASALHVGALLLIPHVDPALVVAMSLLLGASVVFVLYGVYVLEHSARENFLVDAQQAEMDAELACANDALARTVRTDPLTDLANRRHFDEFLSQVWVHAASRQTPVALLLIDIDHFKAYNDHYGHPAGDACLRQVAQAIGTSLRKSGDLVSRWGGEEFAVVLGNASPQAAHGAAQRIAEAVRACAIAHACSPTSALVTVSIGVAVSTPQGDLPLNHIVEAADAMLYAAKAHGRDRITMSPGPEPCTGPNTCTSPAKEIAA